MRGRATRRGHATVLTGISEPVPRLRRLYIDPVEFGQPEIVLSGERARRLGAVLRLRSGAALRVFDGRGREREATLVAQDASRQRATLALGAAVTPLAEPRARVTLCCAFPRGGRGDWLVEKATELGVAAFVALESDRAVLHPSDGRLERWRRIAIEAAEQCGRAVVPTFEDAPPNAALTMVADPGATMTHRQALDRLSGVVESIALYIGPEGGWSDAERAAHELSSLVSLGPRTLRVETAALVALALTIEALGAASVDQA